MQPRPSEAGISIGRRMQIVPAMVGSGGKFLLPALIVTGIGSGFRDMTFSWGHLQAEAPPIVINWFCGWISGGVLTPLLFPFLPGDSLPFKGVMAGGLGFLMWLAACAWAHLTPWSVITAFFLIPVVSSGLSLFFGEELLPGPLIQSTTERKILIGMQAGIGIFALLPWVIPRFV